ncbi:unnamed protein product [Effrenium voratum]|nr:unnamed protein product [Effrenium voratum]
MFSDRLRAMFQDQSRGITCRIQTVRAYIQGMARVSCFFFFLRSDGARRIGVSLQPELFRWPYRAITSEDRRAVKALLVYDTREGTFKNCMKWMEELRQGAHGMVIMLVGNKARDS